MVGSCPPKIRICKLQEMCLRAIRNSSHLTGWVYNLKSISILAKWESKDLPHYWPLVSIPEKVFPTKLSTSDVQTDPRPPCQAQLEGLPAQRPGMGVPSTLGAPAAETWASSPSHVHQYTTLSTRLSVRFGQTANAEYLGFLRGWSQGEPRLGKFQFSHGSETPVSCRVATQKRGLGVAPLSSSESWSPAAQATTLVLGWGA